MQNHFHQNKKRVQNKSHIAKVLFKGNRDTVGHGDNRRGPQTCLCIQDKSESQYHQTGNIKYSAKYIFFLHISLLSIAFFSSLQDDHSTGSQNT